MSKKKVNTTKGPAEIDVSNAPKSEANPTPPASDPAPEMEQPKDTLPPTGDALPPSDSAGDDGDDDESPDPPKRDVDITRTSARPERPLPGEDIPEDSLEIEGEASVPLRFTKSCRALIVGRVNVLEELKTREIKAGQRVSLPESIALVLVDQEKAVILDGDKELSRVAVANVMSGRRK